LGIASGAVWQRGREELLHELRELESRMRRDYAAGLGLIAELDRRNAAVECGYPSLAELLRDVLRISPREAKRRIGQLGASPAIARSYRPCLARILSPWIWAARATRCPPRSAAHLFCATADVPFRVATGLIVGAIATMFVIGPTAVPRN
jgi:hypothetical protein